MEEKKYDDSTPDMMEEPANNSRDVNFQYFNTCLRVKYPEQTVDFLVDNFGMVLLYETELKREKTKHYYLVSSKIDIKYPAANSKQAEELLWSYKGGILQLLYHDGDDKDYKFKINSGNVEPFRGFGHIAFNCDDVYAGLVILCTWI